MYEKGPLGVFFSVSFPNSLNMKKILSFTFVKLVKKLNDIGLFIMTIPSYSFLRLVKLTRMDFSEGWTYSASTCYPLQACDQKIIGVPTRNGGGKLEILSVVSATHSWTWHFLLVLGWDILLFIINLPGLARSFLPSIWSLPCHHDHQSHGSKSYQTPEPCHRYVQELVPLQLHFLLILCIIWNHLHPFVSCRWCGIHHGSPLTWSLPVDINSLSRKLGERLPSSTLELACPNGEFFALDDKFTSLAFVQVISRVFDIISFIHILWIVLLVPWDAFSLLVVSLALVNGSHHWPVIEWLYSMFDINTFIHMLGFVLWSGRLECNTLG